MRIDRDPPSWRVERHRAWQRHERMRRWNPVEEAIGSPAPDDQGENRPTAYEEYFAWFQKSTREEASHV